MTSCFLFFFFLLRPELRAHTEEVNLFVSVDSNENTEITSKL